MALLALFAAFFAFGVGQQFGAPVLGGGDLGTFVFADHYFARNLSWLPAPRLELVSNWSLYPAGTDHVYLHWAFERSYFALLAARLAGAASWYQYYYLLSVLLTVAGAYLILRRHFTATPAMVATFAVSFGNFYAIRKYPTQLPLACVHWATLGVLLDFVIVRRAVLRRGFSARLLLARLAVLAASLGLDLGYIAGFSLLSFTLASGWILLLEAWRCRLRPSRLRAPLGAALRELGASARAHPLQCAALGALLAAALWLYLPLAAQIAGAALDYDFSSLEGYRRWGAMRGQWEHPLRIFLPLLPGPDLAYADRLLGDSGEAAGPHFSPGLGLVLAALGGAVAGRRRWSIYLPFLAVFLLLLFFRPVVFPTLGLFPWFRFARIPGRATAIFPALLAVLALSLPRRSLRRRPGRAAALLVAALFAAETVAAYGDLTVDKYVRNFFYRPDPSLARMLEAIRATPGEALLELPFSVSPFPGPLHRFTRQLKGITQLAQFHGKKVLGANFTRLHPRQIAPFQAGGWPDFFVRVWGPANARRSAGRLGPDEWRWLEGQLGDGDYCGLLIYSDFFSKPARDGLRRRFGRPVATAWLPLPGRMEYYPLRPARSEPARAPPAERGKRRG